MGQGTGAASRARRGEAADADGRSGWGEERGRRAERVDARRATRPEVVERATRAGQRELLPPPSSPPPPLPPSQRSRSERREQSNTSSSHRPLRRRRRHLCHRRRHQPTWVGSGGSSCIMPAAPATYRQHTRGSWAQSWLGSTLPHFSSYHREAAAFAQALCATVMRPVWRLGGRAQFSDLVVATSLATWWSRCL